MEQLKKEDVAQINCTEEECIEDENHGAEFEECIQNPLILSNVLKFLNLKDLKTCRFVNSKWESLASQLVKSKSVISFLHNGSPKTELEFPDSSVTSTNETRRQPSLKELDGEWNNKLTSYQSEMQLFPHSNFKFNLTRLENSDGNYRVMRSKYPKENLSYFTQIQNFINIYGASIKYLELTCRFQTTEDFSLFQQATKNLPNLVHLKLNVYCVNDSGDTSYYAFKPREIRILPLKKLEIVLLTSYNETFQNFVNQFMSLVPKIQSFKISTSGGQDFGKLGKNYFIDYLATYPERVRNLKKIVINKNVIFRQWFNTIAQLPIRLTRLELKLPRLSDPLTLQKLFDFQAPTLVQLSLGIQLVPKYVGPEDYQPIAEILLPPNFPQLRKLAFTYEFGYQGPSLDLDSQQLNVRFNFIEGRKRWDYSKQFPLLQELTLGNEKYCSVSGEEWKIYEEFLPESDVTCERIKVLNVPYLKTSDVPHATICLLEIMNRLDKCFPYNGKYKMLEDSVVRFQSIL